MISAAISIVINMIVEEEHRHIGKKRDYLGIIVTDDCIVYLSLSFK